MSGLPAVLMFPVRFQSVLHERRHCTDLRPPRFMFLVLTMYDHVRSHYLVQTPETLNENRLLIEDPLVTKCRVGYSYLREWK